MSFFSVGTNKFVHCIWVFIEWGSTVPVLYQDIQISKPFDRADYFTQWHNIKFNFFYNYI